MPSASSSGGAAPSAEACLQPPKLQLSASSVG
ncbi:hypothetical protein A2U01_0068455, partial [Trifolium medium]|nr:hypothetical protein [Trifolium medium]